MSVEREVFVFFTERQVEPVKKDAGKLLRRIDVEGLPGRVVDLRDDGVQPRVEVPRKGHEGAPVHLHPVAFHMGEDLDEGHLDVEEQVVQPEPFDPREERVFQLPEVERAFREGLPFAAAVDVDADKLAEDALDGVVLSPRVDEVDGEHGIEEGGAEGRPRAVWRREKWA